MNMIFSKYIYDPWFIAIVSFIVTVTAVPFFNYLIKIARSRFGIFSGQYMGFTWKSKGTKILVEDIRVRNIGNTISGAIKGIAVFDFDPALKQIKSVRKNKGVYQFKGASDERLFVISYKTLIRNLHSAGAIALQGDSQEDIFGVAGQVLLIMKSKMPVVHG